ncbi:MAG: hypothetical protein JSS25_00190 [Proteobacteria bacterium]|nr:hypothetical protein [Pseudomonadota bacterium]
MKIVKYWKLFLLSLPAFAAVFYLMGTAYQQAILARYGVHYSQYSLTFQDAVSNGFISIYGTAFPAALYALLAILVAMVILIWASVITSYDGPREWALRFIQKMQRKREVKPGITELEKATEVVLRIGLIPLSIVVFAALGAIVVQLSLHAGKLSAEQNIQAFAAGKLATYEINGKKASIIVCNDNYCAMWDGKGSFQAPRSALNNQVTNPPTTFNY